MAESEPRLLDGDSKLRLSEILPGSVADFERSVWGGLQIDA